MLMLKPRAHLLLLEHYRVLLCAVQALGSSIRPSGFFTICDQSTSRSVAYGAAALQTWYYQALKQRCQDADCGPFSLICSPLVLPVAPLGNHRTERIRESTLSLKEVTAKGNHTRNAYAALLLALRTSRVVTPPEHEHVLYLDIITSKRTGTIGDIGVHHPLPNSPPFSGRKQPPSNAGEINALVIRSLADVTSMVQCRTTTEAELELLFTKFSLEAEWNRPCWAN